MFCEDEDVELFQNRSVHEFYCLNALITLEQVNISVIKKRRRIVMGKFWWGGKLIGCCKLSLYANKSCDEHAVFLAMIEMMLHVHHIFVHWQ